MHISLLWQWLIHVLNIGPQLHLAAALAVAVRGLYLASGVNKWP